jgi:hypothetical protein
MISATCKDIIIRYVLDASNEENERLAVFIARMLAEKRASFQAAREWDGGVVPGKLPRREEQGGAALEKGAGAVFQERP